VSKNTIPADAISYKNTPEDIELKEWLNTKSGKSAFVKDILKRVMKAEKQKDTFLKLE
jgi:hypothetical protein